MNKCRGCGVLSERELCERCFRIINYNEYKEVEIKPNEFLEIINEINPKELSLLVIDIMDIPRNFDLFKRLKNIILVVTKRDLLPASIKDEKIFYYLNNTNIFKDIVIVSSNKNYNFDLLFEKINEHKISEKAYVIGYTNSGKSTLINKLIYNYSEIKRELTTSMLPSTTLDLMEIEINDNLTIIDTPGIIDAGSISFHLDKSILKKLVLKKPLRPITYQIKVPQHITVEDFLIVEFMDKNDITLYLSNNLNIDRDFEGLETNMLKKEMFVEYGSDLVIKGLGFINIKKRCNINVYVKEGIEVFIRHSII